MNNEITQIKAHENEIIEYIINELYKIDLSIDVNKLKIDSNKVMLEIQINHNTKRIQSSIFFTDIKYIFIKGLTKAQVFLSDTDIKMCGMLTKKNLLLKLTIELNK